MATSPFPNHSPYADPAINRIYNMLFCDDPRVFAPQPGHEPAPWQSILFAKQVQADAVRALANDKQQDPRVRYMAFNWLRQQGHQVPKREMLGAVLEVPMEGGLDVLAVYIDGSVRYLNHQAAPTIIEGPMPLLQQNVSRVLQASQEIVNRIGPSDKARQPAPASNVRLNFLVSDGLYFGEGPMNALSSDAMAGPLLQAGGELLGQLVDLVRDRARA